MVTARPGAAFGVSGLDVTLRPDSAEDFAALFAHELWGGAGAPAAVVHLWSLDGGGLAEPSAAQLDAATKVGTHSALLLLLKGPPQCFARAVQRSDPREVGPVMAAP